MNSNKPFVLRELCPGDHDRGPGQQKVRLGPRERCPLCNENDVRETTFDTVEQLRTYVNAIPAWGSK